MIAEPGFSALLTREERFQIHRKHMQMLPQVSQVRTAPRGCFFARILILYSLPSKDVNTSENFSRREFSLPIDNFLITDVATSVTGSHFQPCIPTINNFSFLVSAFVTCSSPDHWNLPLSFVLMPAVSRTRVCFFHTLVSFS